MDIKNQGADAFKPEVYGGLITIERKISGSSSTTILKDQYGIYLDEFFASHFSRDCGLQAFRVIRNLVSRGCHEMTAFIYWPVRVSIQVVNFYALIIIYSFLTGKKVTDKKANLYELIDYFNVSYNLFQFSQFCFSFLSYMIILANPMLIIFFSCYTRVT